MWGRHVYTGAWCSGVIAELNLGKSVHWCNSNARICELNYESRASSCLWSNSICWDLGERETSIKSLGLRTHLTWRLAKRTYLNWSKHSVHVRYSPHSPSIAIGQSWLRRVSHCSVLFLLRQINWIRLSVCAVSGLCLFFILFAFLRNFVNII